MKTLKFPGLSITSPPSRPFFLSLYLSILNFADSTANKAFPPDNELQTKDSHENKMFSQIRRAKPQTSL